MLVTSPARRRLLAAVSVFLCAGAGAHAVDICGVVPVSALGGSAQDVFVDGTTAYLACDDGGLLIVDVSQASTPTLLAVHETDGPAEGIVVRNDIAYIAVGSAGLEIVDVFSPDNPIHRSTLDTGGYAVRVDVQGGVACIATGSSGLVTANVTNPLSPSVQGELDVVYEYGSYDDVVMDGSIAYVGDEEHGLQVVSIGVPSSPSLIASLSLGSNATRDLELQGDVVYAAQNLHGLVTVDVSTPASPVLLNTLDTPGLAHGVDVFNGLACVADNANGMVLVDVSDPSAPGVLGAIDTIGGAQAVQVSDAGDFMYVAAAGGGLRVIDITEATAPTDTGVFNPPSSTWDVEVRGNTAFLADDRFGLKAVDLSSPSLPAVLSSLVTPDQARAIALDEMGEYAFIASFRDGLHIVDVMDPAAPVSVSTLDTPGRALDVAVSGDVAFVADLESGFHAIDVSMVSTPALLSTLDVASSSVEVVGDVAYVGSQTDTGALLLVDLSDPANLTLHATVENLGQVLDVDIDTGEGIAYVAAHNAGFHVVDVSDPTTPVLLTTVDEPGIRFTGVEIDGNLASFSTPGGFFVYSIVNPASPSLLKSRIVGTTNNRKLAVADDVTYLASGPAGLTILDISTCPSAPDFNLDGVIDAGDLAVLLAAWGSVESAANLDEVGVVDSKDLAILLAFWGL